MSGDIWNTCLFVSDMNRSDCASWVQAWGSILAVLAALVVVQYQHHLSVKRERKKEHAVLRGHWNAIEAELGHCNDQCEVYLRAWLLHRKSGQPGVAPAYRLPTVAYTYSLPHLITSAELQARHVSALLQFYVDAVSFNRCLDNLERMEIEGQGELSGAREETFRREKRRAAMKALHVVSQNWKERGQFPDDMKSLASRLEPALEVIADRRGALSRSP